MDKQIIIAWTLTAPVLFIYLQQGMFRESFDDDSGGRLIIWLYAIMALAAVAFFYAG